ncbi:N-acetylglucosamine-6-phosphate deacetylase [Hahella sp. KA22]|uniref:N-acetylglucosamine-6-phosphate deacetylase n=1 Tax=Hahella sp. KA22 TaxID=1628392 RepID=UPI000FDF1C45|nr:N-acetylglucosamine-6-phosphate deacetylase [Hahella sp. KA22]AZZ95282.1 N-acetylglucosamine-6-phosphate deacetylase [Hahella sp. KA22]QAY52927.1 N-acetylglucosamine-6-phosphate deacetylase [Hahella sp. KA22]
MLTALTDGRIFTGETLLSQQALIIEGGRIHSITPEHQIPADAVRLSLNGMLLAPGYIDVQVNGGGGALFNDNPSPAVLREMGAAHRRYGTTAFMPTLITDTRDKMDAAVRAVDAALREGAPGILGIHLEGPYLNVARKGVHREAVIREPEADALQLLSSLGDIGVTIVTLAPEKVPEGFVRKLRERGVHVCLGHTAASYEQVHQALAEGATGFTHLFNAMTPLRNRDPGVVGAALDDADSWCGLIADNHHVHPATMRIALRAKAQGKIMLVTDAMHSVGMPGEEFELLGEKLVRCNGRLATEQGVLAGSDLDMATAVRNTVSAIGLDVEEALRMASLYPAQFLGIDDEYGRIAPGYRADLVLLNDQLEVEGTWIGGVKD